MRTNHQNVMRGYDYSDVILCYMGSKDIKPMDEVVKMSPKVDKAAPCIYAQMIAEAWGLI